MIDNVIFKVNYSVTYLIIFFIFLFSFVHFSLNLHFLSINRRSNIPNFYSVPNNLILICYFYRTKTLFWSGNYMPCWLQLLYIRCTIAGIWTHCRIINLIWELYRLVLLSSVLTALLFRCWLLVGFLCPCRRLEIFLFFIFIFLRHFYYVFSFF